VRLPYRPEDAIWQADELDNSGASVKKKFIAVLKFASADADEIVLRAEKYKPAIVSEIDAENWFPAELIAQSQLSGDETLKGSAYAVNDFLQTPYTDGRIIRIAETNFFVLELSAF
jgi:hypothetical protein